MRALGTLIVCAGVIAEVDSDTFSSDGVTVCVGDLITPIESSTLGQTAPAMQCSSGIAFGFRPRFWHVKSLMRSNIASASSPKKLGFGPFLVLAALCSFTAASLVWAKYRKYK